MIRCAKRNRKLELKGQHGSGRAYHCGVVRDAAALPRKSPRSIKRSADEREQALELAKTLRWHTLVCGWIPAIWHRCAPRSSYIHFYSSFSLRPFSLFFFSFSLSLCGSRDSVATSAVERGLVIRSVISVLFLIPNDQHYTGPRLTHSRYKTHRAVDRTAVIFPFLSPVSFILLSTPSLSHFPSSF